MSNATQPGNFLADEEKCQSSCPSSPAKLFYHANPGEDVEQMAALDGQHYSDMPNAFRFRTEYAKDCRCKPEPWSAEAKADYTRRQVAATRSPTGQSVAAGVAESAKIAAGGTLWLPRNSTTTAKQALRGHDTATPATATILAWAMTPATELEPAIATARGALLRATAMSRRRRHVAAFSCSARARLRFACMTSGRMRWQPA